MPKKKRETVNDYYLDGALCVMWLSLTFPVCLCFSSLDHSLSCVCCLLVCWFHATLSNYVSGWDGTIYSLSMWLCVHHCFSWCIQFGNLSHLDLDFFFLGLFASRVTSWTLHWIKHLIFMRPRFISYSTPFKSAQGWTRQPPDWQKSQLCVVHGPQYVENFELSTAQPNQD